MLFVQAYVKQIQVLEHAWTLNYSKAGYDVLLLHQKNTLCADVYFRGGGN